MKLLFVTSLKEYQKTVADILTKSDIPVFSVTETIGFKDHHKTNLLDNWFSSGTEQFDSIFVFSFTEENKTEKAMQLIKQYNAENETGFPIRAFVVPVEKSSH
jgi:GTPase Era involved in 16S rRNA processing